MLYMDFVKKAVDLTVIEGDNHLFYLEPLWRTILHDNNLFFDAISDYKVEPEEIEDVLKLEVKKRNTINSNKPFVIDWVYNIITSTVEPAIVDEETDYLKNLIEYMKVNHNLQTENNPQDLNIQDDEWDKFTST